jgi:hypothetical protein
VRERTSPVCASTNGSSHALVSAFWICMTCVRRTTDFEH